MLTYEFEIVPQEITEALFTVDTDDETYTGSGITKDVSGYDTVADAALTEGEDYTVDFSDNIETGTATITITGIGNYTGTLNYTFEIIAKEIVSGMFTVDTDDEIYTGAAITKLITGYDSERNAELVEGVDYVVTYTGNTDAGTATITIDGIGNYTGTLTYTFKIVEEEKGNEGSGGDAGGTGNTGTNGGETTGSGTSGANTADTYAPILYGIMIALAGAAIVMLGVRSRVARR